MYSTSAKLTTRLNFILPSFDRLGNLFHTCTMYSTSSHAQGIPTIGSCDHESAIKTTSHLFFIARWLLSTIKFILTSIQIPLRSRYWHHYLISFARTLPTLQRHDLESKYDLNTSQFSQLQPHDLRRD